MKIKTRYYHLQGKGGYGDGGKILLVNRKIIPLDQSETPARAFYFNQTHLTISCERGDRLSKVDINRILTETEYARTQREYFVYLNWLQQQKLKWMFRKHWLQTRRAKLHLLLLAAFLVLLYVMVFHLFLQ